MEKQELTVKENEGGLISANNEIFANANNSKRYCSLDLTDKSNKVLLYNALDQCDIVLSDIKGQEINVVGVFVETKDIPEKDETTGEILTDKETGEIITKKHFRSILFDDEGKTYVAAAFGVYNSLSKIIPVFGNPTKENPIKVKVGTKKTRSGKDSLILTVVA